MLVAKLSPATKGLLLIALAAALWGTTGIAAKVLFTTSPVPALTLAFLRLAIAAPLFLVLWRGLEAGISGARQGHSRQTAASGFGTWTLLLGLTQAGYQVSYLWAVDLAGAGLATLVALCLAPVVVALVAMPLLGERFNKLILAGLLGAVAGTAMLVAGGGNAANTGVDPQRLIGVGIAAAAAVFYGSFTLISRHTASGRGPYQTAFVCFVTGSLLLLPMVLAQGGIAMLASLSALHWLLILYVGIVPTGLGYICFFKGMKHTPATTSSIIVTLEPLFAALLAWLILGENLGPGGILGAMLLVLAVAAASRGSRMS